MHDCNWWSTTAQGYTQSINKLFEYRGLPIPVDFSDKENITVKLLRAQEHEETIARCRNPITKEMFVTIANRACDSDRGSAESVIFDWITLGRVVGFQVAEYAQTTQNKIDAYEYASGNKVTKAFVSSDWKFYDEKACLMTAFNDLSDLPKKMK